MDIPIPSSLIINVIIGYDWNTEIDHHSFIVDGLIELKLSAWDILYKDEGHVNYEQLKLNGKLGKIIAHELGHFIDAQLDTSFVYSESLRPPDDIIKMVSLQTVSLLI